MTEEQINLIHNLLPCEDRVSKGYYYYKLNPKIIAEKKDKEFLSNINCKWIVENINNINVDENNFDSLAFGFLHCSVMLSLNYIKKDKYLKNYFVTLKGEKCKKRLSDFLSSYSLNFYQSDIKILIDNRILCVDRDVFKKYSYSINVVMSNTYFYSDILNRKEVDNIDEYIMQKLITNISEFLL